MIWPDHMLHDWAMTGGVEPFDSSHINPASIDLTLGNEIFVRGKGTEHFSLKKDVIALNPLESARVHTAEVVKMPINTGGLITLKSSRGRQMWNMNHVGWVDPGFHGQLVFEILNTSDDRMKLELGMKFIQLILVSIGFGGPQTSYDRKENTHYMGSRGAAK